MPPRGRAGPNIEVVARPGGVRDRIRDELVEKFDETFAYDTVKLVNVVDCRLGVIHYMFCLVVLVYVFFYVFFVSKKFLEQEKVQGWVVTQVRNPQYDERGLPWDLYDRWISPGEKGAVFIPTRILATKGQTQNGEFCESQQSDFACSTAEDCDVGDEVAQRAECVSGRCLRREWCPAAEKWGSATTEEHYLEFDEVELKFQTYTHFHKFQMYMATSDETEWIQFPDERANAYRLRDLVQWAGLEPEDIYELGAVLMVNLKLESATAMMLSERTVKQRVESHIIDPWSGFNFVHNHYYYEDGVRKRDSYRMFGLRIMAFATGFAEDVWSSGIVLQLASAYALSGMAEWFTDKVMLQVMPERRVYKNHKIKETEDFNIDDGTDEADRRPSRRGT